MARIKGKPSSVSGSEGTCVWSKKASKVEEVLIKTEHYFCSSSPFRTGVRRNCFLSIRAPIAVFIGDNLLAESTILVECLFRLFAVNKHLNLVEPKRRPLSRFSMLYQRSSLVPSVHVLPPSPLHWCSNGNPFFNVERTWSDSRRRPLRRSHIGDGGQDEGECNVCIY